MHPLSFAWPPEARYGGGGGMLEVVLNLPPVRYENRKHDHARKLEDGCGGSSLFFGKIF